ncbi:uncharacterized protein AC631_04706 [Debaryomyces fabryi]|uniref:F-box domain-containing protein n=1 Tax=Debaryomyces fabryi TaxID=58627 RepID=A0A0V1PTF6_9ASCO|nr:uncharacterized protein AC631_04706 [Debaryomyces fabryi]KRZ99548.1 hypothetical protein AC631_04706 [Debaryomyces fabryi]CUM45531.1 unnamed protein product [Debaryomyces fabryi]
MKKYQLIGRKRVFTKSKPNVNYPTAHLCSLPVEILFEIFNCFEDDLKVLLNLSLVCNKFHTIINKNFLYNNIIITTPRSFSKFSQTHLPSTSHSITRRFGHNEPSNNINLVKTVHFRNPPTSYSSNRTTKIAGTYDVESVRSRDEQVSFDEYIHSFTSLLKEAYGLKTIAISEISPEFSFPNDIPFNSSSVFSSFKSKRPSRILGKLILKAQSGWSIPFRISHISTLFNVYDTIDEVVLHNFVVDDLKLASNSSKIGGINRLTLISSIYSNSLSKKVPNQRKKCPEIFLDVTELRLLNILSGSDLSVIDVIKQNGKLSKLTLDLDSQIFYLMAKNSNMEKQFNFARYNLFFKLLCSGQGSYANLTELELINFDLFGAFRHKHKVKEEEEEGDDWIAPLTDTFENLLVNLSTIQNLTIVLKQSPKKVRTCTKCGFTESEQPDKKILLLNNREWAILLQPLLSENEDCTVNIFDHKGNRIFVRSKYI